MNPRKRLASSSLSLLQQYCVILLQLSDYHGTYGQCGGDNGGDPDLCGRNKGDENGINVVLLAFVPQKKSTHKLMGGSVN